MRPGPNSLAEGKEGDHSGQFWVVWANTILARESMDTWHGFREDNTRLVIGATVSRTGFRFGNQGSGKYDTHVGSKCWELTVL